MDELINRRPKKKKKNQRGRKEKDVNSKIIQGRITKEMKK